MSEESGAEGKPAPEKPRPASAGCMIVPALLLTLFVGAADVVLYRGLRGMIRAGNYETTTGRIMAMQLGRRKGGLYVKYRYEVEGRKYTSNRVRYIMEWPRQRNRQFHQAHKVDGEVTVHYDPQDPAASVLSTEPLGFDYVYLAASAIFNLATLAAWGFIVWLIRRRKRRGMSS